MPKVWLCYTRVRPQNQEEKKKGPDSITEWKTNDVKLFPGFQ